MQEIKELKRNIARPTRMPHEARQDAKRLNALVTEIERLQEALERIAGAPFVSGDRGCGKYKDIARAALNAKVPDD